VAAKISSRQRETAAERSPISLAAKEGQLHWYNIETLAVVDAQAVAGNGLPMICGAITLVAGPVVLRKSPFTKHWCGMPG